MTTPASEKLRGHRDQARKQNDRAPDLHAGLKRRGLGAEDKCEAATMTQGRLELENVATVWALSPGHSVTSFWVLISLLNLVT